MRRKTVKRNSRIFSVFFGSEPTHGITTPPADTTSTRYRVGIISLAAGTPQRDSLTAFPFAFPFFAS
jgi:hypothetical protein